MVARLVIAGVVRDALRVQHLRLRGGWQTVQRRIITTAQQDDVTAISNDGKVRGLDWSPFLIGLQFSLFLAGHLVLEITHEVEAGNGDAGFVVAHGCLLTEVVANGGFPLLALLWRERRNFRFQLCVRSIRERSGHKPARAALIR